MGIHIMATANLNKSEDLVANTTTASNYIKLGGPESGLIQTKINLVNTAS